MTHENRFPDRMNTLVESSEGTTPVRSMAIMRAHEWRHWLVPIVFALTILVLITRLAGRKDLLVNALTYPTFLKVAMQASTGQPFDTAALNEVLPHGTPTGFQARAMSKVAQATGLSTTAERWLVHGLADNSSSYLSQFELCLLYWNGGQRAKARETCRNTQDSARYWLYQGYEADQSGDATEALALYQMAAATDPNLVTAWHQLGRALFAAKQFDEAVLAYERVLMLDQTTPADVFDSLSLSYLAIGNPTMARDVLERGLLLYPGQRGYYLNMAAAFRAEGNPQTADSWYARMLQRWPADAQAWAARADIATDAGRFDDAVTYYQEATRQQPQNIEYWLNLASVAGTAERVRVATDAYMTAMALQPENVGILLQAGRFFVKSGQLTAAQEAFEQALVLQPENGEAAALLSELVKHE